MLVIFLRPASVHVGGFPWCASLHGASPDIRWPEPACMCELPIWSTLLFCCRCLAALLLQKVKVSRFIQMFLLRLETKTLICSLSSQLYRFAECVWSRRGWVGWRWGVPSAEQVSNRRTFSQLGSVGNDCTWTVQENISKKETF